MAYIGNDPKTIVQGRRAVYEFTATSGQNVFSGTDENGLALDLLQAAENEVYLNGVRLIITDDYTISGDTLTLVSGAATGDKLIVVTQDQVTNAGTYTKLEADSRYINTTGDIITGDLQINGEIDVDDLVVNNRIGVGYNNPQDNIHILGSDATPNVGITLQSDDTANATSTLTLMARDASNVNQTVQLQNTAGNQTDHQL